MFEPQISIYLYINDEFIATEYSIKQKSYNLIKYPNFEPPLRKSFESEFCMSLW